MARMLLRASKLRTPSHMVEPSRTSCANEYLKGSLFINQYWRVEGVCLREVPRGAMWEWYRLRSILLQMNMMIAPHEILLAHTFADPSPASDDGASRP